MEVRIPWRLSHLEINFLTEFHRKTCWEGSEFGRILYVHNSFCLARSVLLAAKCSLAFRFSWKKKRRKKSLHFHYETPGRAKVLMKWELCGKHGYFCVLFFCLAAVILSGWQAGYERKNSRCNTHLWGPAESVSAKASLHLKIKIKIECHKGLWSKGKNDCVKVDVWWLEFNLINGLDCDPFWIRI